MVTIFDEHKQARRLDELHTKEAEDLALILSQKYDIPYVDLSKLPINTDAIRLIPEAEARAAQIAAFKVSGKRLAVVISSPSNPKTQKIIDELENKNFKVETYLGSVASLNRALERYREISQSVETEGGVVNIANVEIESFLKQIKNLEEIKARLTRDAKLVGQMGGVTNLLEIILAGAIFAKASDVHLEPQENRARVRYRIDGVLNDFVFLDIKTYRSLLSRIKLVSGLKLNLKNSAQDGRFSIRIDQDEVEVRSSSLPGAYGESSVLRILNPVNLLVDFEKLGMEPLLLETTRKQITKPNGMILLTGPTGSGKTTTLYSILRILSKSSNKVITIEDPIEYHLEGVNQTQVNRERDYTFLTGLRAALRQDPDIIMIGEIRDSETAEIANNSALTGHLVLSTLHTNNAAGTIPRLIDLGINPKTLEASLNAAIAQRLVRKLCPNCRQPHPVTDKERQLIEVVWQEIAKKRPKLKLPPELTLWQPLGCTACHGTGYQGRIGIFEAILMTPAVVNLLDSSQSEHDIKKAAEGQNLLDLREDGVVKVVGGITSLVELGRVVDVYG